ncbi:hypothetical protein ZOSMA_24G00600 [Zostera marina]|uniref:Uncharacterized protein n=1 Tax=Zostera marina TaxID=29655 RepID=A0A0K9PGD2_ZOSMR|nr:hypothetical protein ZOSMA_24G00600 [Zostera marina]
MKTLLTFENFMKTLLSHLRLRGNSNGGLMSMIGGLAQEFVSQKLDNGANESLDMNKKNDLPDTEILLSRCQTN